MATKIYVGNLSYETTDDSLRSLFAEAGNVTSAQVVTDRYTGQARGFGFVEMSTDGCSCRGCQYPECERCARN